jgi:O-antigen/teichoic acid export membrane protein
MMLRLANSLLAWIATLAAALLLGYRGTALAAVVFAGLYNLTLNLTNYCRGIFRAFEDLRQEAAMLVIEKLLVIGGGLLLLITTQLASWTLAGMAAGMTFAAAANTWWIDHRFAKLRLELLSRDFMKRSLKIMIPFGLAGLFTVIYYRIDMVMVEALLGEAPTGQYGAAFRILEALFMLPALVALAAVYPRLARLYHEEAYAKFAALLKNSFLGLVGVGLVITTAIFMTAGPIIEILDPDPAYGPAAEALRILVWTFPFLCANFLLYSALLSMDQQRFASVALAVAVAMNVTLNAFMIPMYGINGAAVASVIPEVTLVGIYLGRYRYARRHLTIQPKT